MSLTHLPPKTCQNWSGSQWYLGCISPDGIAVAVGVGSLLNCWDWKTLIGWRALVDYIEPKDPTGRKDAVQVCAVIVAGWWRP